MEDAEEHLPSEAGDHGREEAKKLEAPPIAVNQRSVRRRRSASMRSSRQSWPRRPTSQRTPRSA